MANIGKYLGIAAFSLLFLTGCGNSSKKEAAAPLGNDENKEEKVMTKQSGNFIFAADVPWDDAGNGAVRQILGYNDDIMMVKVKFKKGDIGSMHSHPHSQVTYVAAGKFEFTVGGVTKIVETGDALYKQPGIEHGCVCLEDGILIDCFNPMRDTFLKD